MFSGVNVTEEDREEVSDMGSAILLESGGRSWSLVFCKEDGSAPGVRSAGVEIIAVGVSWMNFIRSADEIDGFCCLQRKDGFCLLWLKF